MSSGFADTYLHFATLIALAPALMVCVGLGGAHSKAIMSPTCRSTRPSWAPRIALTSVAAGLCGVLVALLSGLSRFWLRALLAVAITTVTLFGYVWDREVRQPTAALIEPVAR